MASNQSDNEILNELIEKISQLLSHQVEHNANLSEAAKESLAVANECIEQAFKVQKKPPSQELLEIYKKNTKSGEGTSTSASTSSPPLDFSSTLVQNLATTIMSQATNAAAASRGDQSGADASNPIARAAAMAQQIFGAAAGAGSAGTPASATTSSTTEATPPPRVPKTRKKPTEAEKMAAESFKNQGNDAMKQDKYQEAMDYYTQAISIDDSNAIYYSNRAAAKSKVGDHSGALTDCQDAIEIDPAYSKAYGRMGLAYACLEDHRNAKKAYQKAVELDPNNESYRNNLQIAEEKLDESGGSRAAGAGGSGAGGNDMANILTDLMTNPQVLQMAVRTLQDSRVQSLFSNLGANLGGGGGGSGAGGGNTGGNSGSGTGGNNNN